MGALQAVWLALDVEVWTVGDVGVTVIAWILGWWPTFRDIDVLKALAFQPVESKSAFNERFCFQPAQTVHLYGAAAYGRGGVQGEPSTTSRV